MESKLMQIALEATYNALENNQARVVNDLKPEEIRWEKTMANKWKHQD